MNDEPQSDRRWWLPWHWTPDEWQWAALCWVLTSVLLLWAAMDLAWRESDWVMAQPVFQYLNRFLRIW